MNYITTSLMIMLLPFLLSCASDDVAYEEEGLAPAIDVYDEFEIMLETNQPPEEDLFVTNLAEKIIMQLMGNIDLLSSREPMVVTTPVLADNFYEKVTLSHYLQQAFLSELHEYRFVVVDVNLSDFIQIKPSGEFMLSRNWESLSPNVEVQMVLVTTMVPDKKGMSISTRIINVHSRRVMASSLVYVKAEDMSNFFRLSRLITETKDGVLELNEDEGMQEIYILEESNTGAIDEGY